MRRLLVLTAALFLASTAGAASEALPGGVKKHEKACRKGVTASCAEAGRRYVKGDGVDQDVAKGLQFHDQACELMDASSCAGLGLLYVTGELGVPADGATAFAYFDKACGLGLPAGCYMLGAHYAGGLGVEKDLVAAERWFLAACDAGEAEACEAAGVLAMERGDPESAAARFARGCDGGDGKACFELAAFTASGAGVPQDEAAAKALREKACANGYTEACGG